MNDALKAAGADVTLVKLDGDDHFLSSTATRTKMLEAVDTFLKRVMPVQP